MAMEESELDIASLMQGRQGYLWKLGGGQEKGSKWNRRWSVAPSHPSRRVGTLCFLLKSGRFG